MKKSDTKFFRFAKTVICFLFRIIFWPKYINKEVIPKEGKVIFAGNHTALLDPVFLIGSGKRLIYFLAKKELLEGPLGFIFKRLHLISVDRQHKENNQDVFINAYKKLAEGEMVGIFPEATHHKKELLPLRDFKIGAVKMAKESNTLIIPFAVVTKYRPFRRNVMVFSDPVDVKDMDLESANKLLKETVESLIRNY